MPAKYKDLLKTDNISVRVRPEDKADAMAMAYEDGTTLSALVNTLVLRQARAWRKLKEEG